MQTDFPIPKRVAVCPHCAGALHLEVNEWEEPDGAPTEAGCHVSCKLLSAKADSFTLAQQPVARDTVIQDTELLPSSMARLQVPCTASRTAI